MVKKVGPYSQTPSAPRAGYLFFFALLRTGLSVVGFEFFDCVRYLDKADIA